MSLFIQSQTVIIISRSTVMSNTGSLVITCLCVAVCTGRERVFTLSDVYQSSFMEEQARRGIQLLLMTDSRLAGVEQPTSAEAAGQALENAGWINNHANAI